MAHSITKPMKRRKRRYRRCLVCGRAGWAQVWRERVLVTVDREAIWWQDTRTHSPRFGWCVAVTSSAATTLYSRSRFHPTHLECDMSMKRSAILCALVLAFGFQADPSLPTAMASNSSDTQVLSRASVQMGHDSSHSVVRWLRLQMAVASASVGPDRRTVSIRFRDGFQAAILTPTLRKVGLPRLGALLRPGAPSSAPAVQAAVWEPFASELGLGPNAGDIEVQQLQAAGFAVDQKYDTSVTVAQMATLSRFNVVYMHTHSGLTASGDGIVASGEPVNGDSSVAPFLADGSVITVGVAGSAQQYYGITGTFITRHEGIFPSGSLLFLNGCALLRSTTFWQALHSRGVSTLVSWDQNGAAKDDFLSAAAFFNVMGTGQTVAGAISTLRASGYGTSSDNGVPATLGYAGDGTLTLHGAAVTGGPGPTPPIATSTTVPVATSTATPVVTATPIPTATAAPSSTSTSTPVPTHPPVPAFVSLSNVVNPGATQRISVSNLLPSTALQIRVTFPNGETVVAHANADSAGHAQFSFLQAGSTLTRHSRIAQVEITATTSSGTATTTMHFTVGFGKVDVVVQPRALPPGGAGAILVHTRAHKSVTVTLHFASGKKTTLRGLTGSHGWVKLRFNLPRSAKRGRSVTVRAVVRLHGKSVRASSALSIT
jgi:hypothetical protein